MLTHWGRVTHMCVGKLTIIDLNNVMSPGRRQAIIWTNAAILLIGPLRTNFSEILNEFQTFSLKKIRLKMSSAKCCPFCLCLNMLNYLPGGSVIFLPPPSLPYLSPLITISLDGQLLHRWQPATVFQPESYGVTRKWPRASCHWEKRDHYMQARRILVQ